VDKEILECGSPLHISFILTSKVNFLRQQKSKSESRLYRYSCTVCCIINVILVVPDAELWHIASAGISYSSTEILFYIEFGSVTLMVPGHAYPFSIIFIYCYVHT
jgi:hypothetical protein